MYSRGVDRFDQLISYYTIDHKSVKWYLRIVLHLISVAMYNSFILYSKSKGKKTHYGTYLQFEQSVIESLVAEMRNRKRTEKIPKDYLNIFLTTPKTIRRSSTSTISTTASNMSTISKTSITSDDCKLDYNGKANCSLCGLNKKRKQTSYWCVAHKIPICYMICYDNHRKLHRIQYKKKVFY